MTFDERRSELIDAAVRVIARDGLTAATTRAIVAEAGMPQGALFYVFPSREALLSAVIEHVTDQEQLTAILSADMVMENMSVRDVVREALDGYLRLLEEDPAREIALLELATHSMRHDPDAVRTQWQTYRDSVADAMRYLAERMSFRWSLPLDQLAHVVTASIDGLTVSWLTDRDSAAARRHLDILASTIAGLAVAHTDSDSSSDTDSEGELTPS
ncbi:TetR/AcrR family transcriptional regulator [Gordonia sp. NPDC003429]